MRKLFSVVLQRLLQITSSTYNYNCGVILEEENSILLAGTLN